MPSQKPDPVPQEMTVERASEFWDEHSVADYPSKIIPLEFEPQSHTRLVAVEDGLINQLQTRARETRPSSISGFRKSSTPPALSSFHGVHGV